MGYMQRLFVEPFEKWYETILFYLPNILSFLLVMVVGVLFAVFLKKVLIRILRGLKIDKLSERYGVIDALSKSGIRDPLSVICAKGVGGITIIIFIVLAMGRLQIPAIQSLLEKFFLYLPNIFLAGLILIFGYLLSNFFGRAALIAAVNTGIRHSGFAGKFTKFTIFTLSATMALEQLGIGKDTVVIAFAIFFGGVVLAFAIAFGLGGQDSAKRYLEKKMNGDEEKDTIDHL